MSLKDTLDLTKDLTNQLIAEVEGARAANEELRTRNDELETELAIANSEIDRLREQQAKTEGISWPD